VFIDSFDYREVLTPPSTPSSSKTNDSASSKKKSLALAHSRLVAHKYSSAFMRPISNKTVVGYEDVIYKFVSYPPKSILDSVLYNDLCFLFSLKSA